MPVSAVTRHPYDRRVFINCPFDTTYRPMFDAIVFAVLACHFTPHSALEITDAGKPRIGIIANLIGTCRLGVHDISRVELNDNGLPRFNMPLELGLWLGAERFGSPLQRRKQCLILDSERFRYQQFISDIGGQDIVAHGSDAGLAIRHVRNFLQAAVPEDEALLPGGADIARRFGEFQTILPMLCETARIDPDELTFIDHARLTLRWLIGSEPSE
jgi:hypothetical protein